MHTTLVSVFTMVNVPGLRSVSEAKDKRIQFWLYVKWELGQRCRIKGNKNKSDLEVLGIWGFEKLGVWFVVKRTEKS